LLFNLLLVCWIFLTEDHNYGTMTLNYYKHATLCNVLLTLFSINTQHEKMKERLRELYFVLRVLPQYIHTLHT